MNRATSCMTAEEIEAFFNSLLVRWTRPFALFVVAMLQRLCRFQWEQQGLEELLRLTPPWILAANHTSHADTAAILDVLPQRLRDRTAVAAAWDVFGRSPRPLQVLTAAGFHAFAFKRHGNPLCSLRTSIQLINRGWNLLIYPEGTRCNDGRIQAFKPGVALIAKVTSRPVVPVFVTGGNEVLPPGAVWPRSGTILVRFRKPIWYRQTDSPESFVQRLRQTYADQPPTRIAKLPL